MSMAALLGKYAFALASRPVHPIVTRRFRCRIAHGPLYLTLSVKAVKTGRTKYGGL